MVSKSTSVLQGSGMASRLQVRPRPRDAISLLFTLEENTSGWRGKEMLWSVLSLRVNQTVGVLPHGLVRDFVSSLGLSQVHCRNRERVMG